MVIPTCIFYFAFDNLYFESADLYIYFLILYFVFDIVSVSDDEDGVEFVIFFFLSYFNFYLSFHFVFDIVSESDDEEGQPWHNQVFSIVPMQM